MGDRESLVGPLDPAFPLLAEAAAELGVRAWAVGGYVRDRLLGLEHREIDVVVEDGRGPELAAYFARLTGSASPVVFERFGTAQVMWGDRPVEFASARAESYRDDSRKPDVQSAGIDDDLRRRDFTVNALLMDFDGRLEDRLGTGLADLRARLLRTPLDPLATFSDDPLRMLRAVRFAAQLDFGLDPALLPAMRQLADRLRPPVVSIERVAEELRKMLLSERPKKALELLDAGGLLAGVLPELAACKGVAQGGYHSHDVYGHTLETVARTPPWLIVRLAALFHDTGKPATASPAGSFLGHEKVGAELAQAALARLRLSNNVIERVAHLVRLHLRPVYYEPEWTDGAVRRLAREAGPDLPALLQLAHADIAASAYDKPEKLEELERRLAAVLAESPSRLSSPVTGEDIMRARGLAPGPEVGKLKARLDELVLEGKIEPKRDAVLRYLEAHPDLD
ncbi:MAG: CCA tRNA nucleotidyltransferase [Candidatus Dormibacteraeota bacterium]|nr:CCA tRNA nucleotidyltransferase [Candidatus Dormibacteraeota bacterium]